MGGRVIYQGGQVNLSARRPIIWLAIAAAAAFGNIHSVFAVAPTPAFTWDATGTSDYNTPTNWNPDLAAAPANADNQFLTINNGATAAINGDSQGAFLILGLSTGQSGNLVINSGTSTFGELRVGGRDSVPDDYNSATPVFSPNNGGSGTVIQNPGTTVNVNYDAGTEPPVASFYVGDSAGLTGNAATGSYTITGTPALPSALNSGILGNDSIIIGTGTGTVATFNQGTVALPDSTTVTTTGFISVGRRGANGTYTMRGGTLSANGTQNPGIVIGDGDSGITGPPVGTGITSTVGTFNQFAGTVNDSQDLRIGRRNATGTYNMSGGDLNITGSLVLGGPESDGYNMNGNATFNLSNGTVTLPTGNVNIANTSTSAVPTVGTTGLMTITGGSLNLNGASAILAVGNGIKGTGTLDLSGGTVSVNTSNTSLLDIGRNQAAALVKVSGTGTLNVGQLTLNSTSPTAGPVTHELRIEGGTVNVKFWEQGAVVPTNLTRVVNMSGGNLNVTDPAAAHRGGRLVTYNFSGGTAIFAGAMPMDTSTVNISNTANVTFGTYRTQSATTNITGGSLTATTVNDTGNQGGTTTISGGTVNVSGTWNVTNATPGTAGTLNIGGGTTTVGTLATGGANSLLYISGGTNTFTNLTLSSTTTFKTDNAISLGSNVTFGNATVNVNSGSLSLNGSLTTGAVRTLTKTGPGALNVNGTQSYVAGTGTIINAGTMNYNSSASGTNLAVTVGSAGTLGGSGTVGGAVTNNGTIAPGVAGGTNIGTLTTNADVTDGANSNWAIELNGASSDKLAVNGNINLSAIDSLNVSGTPGSSTSWIIGTYTGILSGAFDTITSGYSVNYSGGNITLNLAALPGDFNGDGKVNASDYVSLRKQFPVITSGAGLTAYTTWRTNFGNGGFGSGSSLGGAQVPEPASFALLCVLVSLVGIRRPNRVRV